MKYSKVNLVYFSATDTTKTVVEAIAKGFNIDEITTYNITKGQKENILFDDNEIVIFGMPVYSGRIPQVSIEHLHKFRGNKTPAVIVCVYGNRDYDDALLELKNTVKTNDFEIISAGVFIGQHSIFPETGRNRPDTTDKDEASKFGRLSMGLLEKREQEQPLPDIQVQGNFPYKEIKSIPIKPKANGKCDKCGKCARNCPTNAISMESLRKTDKTLCISCARCIYVCPQKARKFGGIIYKIASKKFNKAYAERKNSEEFFAL